MALDFRNYSPAKYVPINGAAISLQKHYVTIATNTNGNLPVSIFGVGQTAPTSGSITGFYAMWTSGVVSGTATLAATTGGTLAWIPLGTGTLNFVGAMGGTTTVTGSFAAGDTVAVSNSSFAGGAGTFTCFVTIQTSS